VHTLSSACKILAGIRDQLCTACVPNHPRVHDHAQLVHDLHDQLCMLVDNCAGAWMITLQTHRQSCAKSSTSAWPSRSTLLTDACSWIIMQGHPHSRSIMHACAQSASSVSCQIIHACMTYAQLLHDHPCSRMNFTITSAQVWSLMHNYPCSSSSWTSTHAGLCTTMHTRAWLCTLVDHHLCRLTIIPARPRPTLAAAAGSLAQRLITHPLPYSLWVARSGANLTQISFKTRPRDDVIRARTGSLWARFTFGTFLFSFIQSHSAHASGVRAPNAACA